MKDTKLLFCLKQKEWDCNVPSSRLTGTDIRS